MWVVLIVSALRQIGRGDGGLSVRSITLRLTSVGRHMVTAAPTLVGAGGLTCSSAACCGGGGAIVRYGGG